MENNLLVLLSEQDRYKKEDLELMKLLIRQYINNGFTYCMHCPGSVKKLVNDFRSNIKTIIESYGKE